MCEANGIKVICTQLPRDIVTCELHTSGDRLICLAVSSDRHELTTKACKLITQITLYE